MPQYLNFQFGDYQLERLLGEGGFAEVYEARQIHLGTKAAIKVLKASFTPQQIEELRKEALIISELGEQHPHIVRLLTFSIERSIPYLVMSYAPGGSLDKLHPRGKILPLPTIVTYVRQIAAALQHAHNQCIIHRDIKPANFLLLQDGQVQVADFGLALMAHSSTSWTPQEIVGTWIYMAPEQFQRQAVPASDQYALGIVVYQWLCGEPPFTGEGSMYALPHQHMNNPPPSLCMRNLDVPAEVEQVVFKALAKKPEERYASIQAFADALAQATKKPSLGTTLLVYEQQGDTINTLAWSPDGTCIASGGCDTATSICDATTGKTLLTLRGPTNPVRMAAWSPDGRWLASASRDQTVYVWEASTGRLLYRYHTYSSHVLTIAWSPDGRWLASGNADKTVHVWEASTGRLLHRYQAYTFSAQAVTWSPDGRSLAASHADYTVHVREASTGRLLRYYQVHTFSAQAVAWSSDGRLLAAGSDDKTVHVWEASTGRLLHHYQAHSSHVHTIAWSPDGCLLASSSDDHTVHIWAASTGRLLQRYQAHSSHVLTIAWSPDGLLLASADCDGTVQLWRVTSGRTLYTYRGHAGLVNSVAWSPSGDLIVSAGCEVQVWQAR